MHEFLRQIEFHSSSALSNFDSLLLQSRRTTMSVSFEIDGKPLRFQVCLHSSVFPQLHPALPFEPWIAIVKSITVGFSPIFIQEAYFWLHIFEYSVTSSYCKQYLFDYRINSSLFKDFNCGVCSQTQYSGLYVPQAIEIAIKSQQTKTRRLLLIQLSKFLAGAW